MKLGQDDKQFMMTEEVAAFCTTPGGRRRDDMNFYTSGMKIVDIKEEEELSSAQVCNPISNMDVVIIIE